MNRREEIKSQVKSIENQIKSLEEDLEELIKEEYLLCDEKQWFTEKEEETIVKKRPLVKETNLIGRINWEQEFIDEDSQEVIKIERSMIVRANGKWL